MSDPESFAARLAEKLGYTNTFYHRVPLLDIAHPGPEQLGCYDFIVSSEVMEHVPPPVEQSFANLCRLLKPDGVLLLTVPYRAVGEHEEHFPELYEYGLTSLGGRTVLVNRRRDGSTEVFDDIRFHGGDGSTLEMRVFTEASLKQTLLDAGFTSVRVAVDSIPEFGIEHGESNSLPIVARKGEFDPPAPALAEAYSALARTHRSVRQDLEELQHTYRRYVEFHNQAQADLERQLAERDASARLAIAGLEQQLAERDLVARQAEQQLRADYARHVEFHEQARSGYEARLAEQAEWVRKTEQLLEQRTRWAQDLEREKDEVIANFRRVEQDLADARRGREELEARRWVRLGRKLGTLR
jgi:SAM-dependent methyltransferase